MKNQKNLQNVIKKLKFHYTENTKLIIIPLFFLIFLFDILKSILSQY